MKSNGGAMLAAAAADDADPDGHVRARPAG